jgi:16S rRNA G966 N2-methylase RsmD
MLYEAEVLPGLEPFVSGELTRLFGSVVTLRWPDEAASAVSFEYSGPQSSLLALRTAAAVYRVLHFDISRPKALLGHEHFTRLTARIDHVRGSFPAGTFRTFRISAAGRDSSVFRRLQTEIAAHTHLIYEPDDADLFLRVRPAQWYSSGWEVLLRISPRPLSARAWRVCNMPGALNATLAAAMVELTAPRDTDRFFNPMCGSGTLLIERAHRGLAEAVGGCDTSAEALRCAQGNVQAAGMEDMVSVFEMDATALSLPEASCDVICADLPWGQLTGIRDETAVLYRRALVEWARVAAHGARLVVITHALASFNQALTESHHVWHLERRIKVFQGGLHPQIFVFRRA